MILQPHNILQELSEITEAGAGPELFNRGPKFLRGFDLIKLPYFMYFDRQARANSVNPHQTLLNVEATFVTVCLHQAVKCILVQNIYSELKKIGNLWEKYRKKIGNL